MKISKRVGRMALKHVGTPWTRIWPYTLEVAIRKLGWTSGGDENSFGARQGFRDINSEQDHNDTLMCLIASIAGVKPGDLK